MVITKFYRNLARWSRQTSTIAAEKNPNIEINIQNYPTDDYTNVTPKILSYVDRNLHIKNHHPLSLVRASIVDYVTLAYPNTFKIYDNLHPVVPVTKNFDNLFVPIGHPSRAKSDCYYINKNTILRAHTTAHSVDMLRIGVPDCIVIGDVYRRDEIDSTHFPVFHQVDGVRSQTKIQLFPDQPDLQIFKRNYKPAIKKISEYCPKNEKIAVENSSNKQDCHTIEAVKVMEYQLKHALIGMVKHLFGENIDFRWVDAYFPFTQPSWELEIFYNDKWMEVLGCGILRQEIMHNAGCGESIAYAFGMGLERLAMALYNIPDIRLFWSNDSGFLNQFKNSGKIIKYKSVSVYPQCTNDISFWLPKGTTKSDFIDNDFYELVRDIGGDIIEQVNLVDVFEHPKIKLTSLCYRIVYRHMERTLTKEEVNKIHKKIEEISVNTFKVTLR